MIDAMHNNRKTLYLNQPNNQIINDSDDSSEGEDMMILDHLDTYKRGNAQITSASAISFINM